MFFLIEYKNTVHYCVEKVEHEHDFNVDVDVAILILENTLRYRVVYFVSQF